MLWILQVTGILSWIVRAWTDVENNIVSVERVNEYAETPKEVSVPSQRLQNKNGHGSSPKVKPKLLNRPLVVGCSIDPKRYKFFCKDVFGGSCHARVCSNVCFPN